MNNQASSTKNYLLLKNNMIYSKMSSNWGNYVVFDFEERLKFLFGCYLVIHDRHFIADQKSKLISRKIILWHHLLSVLHSPSEKHLLFSHLTFQNFDKKVYILNYPTRFGQKKMASTQYMGINSEMVRKQKLLSTSTKTNLTYCNKNWETKIGSHLNWDPESCWQLPLILTPVTHPLYKFPNNSPKLWLFIYIW